ncbi:MAG: P83/100 family protein, partial [Spirochaetota bacterium]
GKSAGLSTKYWEWPGKSNLVIPLSEAADGGKQVDIFTVADRGVIEQLRKRDDRSIEARKEIISLKEKQLTQESGKNSSDKQAIQKEKQTLEVSQKDLDKKKQSAAKEKALIREERTSAEKMRDPNDKKAAQSHADGKEKEAAVKDVEIKKEEIIIAEKKALLAEKEQAVVSREKNTEEKKTALAEEKTQLSLDSEISEKKKSSSASVEMRELKKERDTLAEQKERVEEKAKELKQKETELQARSDKIFRGKFYYLKINNYFNDGYYNNELFIINPESGKTVLKSPYGKISGRKYDISASGVVIIGYEGKANFDHRLVLLDPETLAPKAKGEDIIFWRSFVEIRDGQIYAVLSENGNFYLSRCDESLKRVARSDRAVDKDTAISFYGDFIYINSPDKLILVLNKKDLSYIKTIDPEKDTETGTQ